MLAQPANDLTRAILLAGPTGSGKSALAIRLAKERSGVIVNADSMQVYRDLRVLTARPSARDEAGIPHRLYGHVDGAEAWSVARWLADVERVLRELWSGGRLPIVVGGTGLYFKALLEGLAPVPEILPAARARWREAAKSLPPGELHAALSSRDPTMAARLDVRDLQRLARALEVVDSTGRSLADWQRGAAAPLLRVHEVSRFRVMVDRAVVRERCDARLEAMVAAGALEEVAALAARGLPLELPVMRAIGVEPLMAHLAGRLTLAEALTAAKLATRQYVKRQETWLNRWMADWTELPAAA